MIRKQTQLNMAKVATIEFGFGSVHMIAGCKDYEDKSIGVLFLDTQEPQTIGAKQPYEQPMIVKESDHEVLMTFENIESIDALISSLQDVKKTVKLSKVSNRVEFNARCNAIIEKLRKLHAFFTNKKEHILAQTCIDLVDDMNTNILNEDLSRASVGESLLDVYDTIKQVYYNDATPPDEVICLEILGMIHNLATDLVDLI